MTFKQNVVRLPSTANYFPEDVDWPLPSPVGREGNATIHINGQICKDCNKAVRDVLTNSTTDDNGWQSRESENGAVTFLTTHSDGGFSSLVASKIAGCELCALMVSMLLEKSGDRHGSGYHIFVNPRDRARNVFYVCSGDVLRFIKHYKEWYQSQPSPLAFFTQDDDSRARFDQSLSTQTIVSNFMNSSGCRLDFPKLPDIDPGSERSFQQAETWLNECIREHQICNRTQGSMPKRVIYTGDVNSTGMLYLHLPVQDENKPYATVSYSWGTHTETKTFKRLKTLNGDPKHTVGVHQSGIKLDQFPETLQDAIKITDRLGFKYLWIDSVCIVQDDEEDWALQSAAMTQIYAGARLNVSATSSENSEWGILKRRERYGVKVGHVQISAGKREPLARQSLILGAPLATLDLEDKYGSTRGWVFQERLVSPATLHYTDDGMLFECAHGIKIGHGQDFKSENWKAQWKAVEDATETLISSHAEEEDFKPSPEDVQRQCRAWNHWISSYSERSLYTFTDRLPAVAGLAKTINKTFRLEYVAGLWKQDLINGLMWRRFNRTKILNRFKDDKTPSWSWASVQGRLEYKTAHLKPSINGPVLQLLDVLNVEQEQANSFGRVTGGMLKLRGLLQKVEVDKGIHPGVRQREWQEVGIRTGFEDPVNVLVTLDDHWMFEGQFYECWCLRIGSHNESGRIGDFFLLLDRTGTTTNQFKRIGFIETEPWANSVAVIEASGRLKNPRLSEVLLV